MSHKTKYEDGQKTPYSFEVMDSVEGELAFAQELEADDRVLAWTKNHDIKIPYRDERGKVRNYLPDFLVRYKSDNRLWLVEVKGRHISDSRATKLKERAGEIFCRERNMVYQLRVY